MEANYEAVLGTAYGTKRYLYFGAAQAVAEEYAREGTRFLLQMFKDGELVAWWADSMLVPKKEAK